MHNEIKTGQGRDEKDLDNHLAGLLVAIVAGSVILVAVVVAATRG